MKELRDRIMREIEATVDVKAMHVEKNSPEATIEFYQGEIQALQAVLKWMGEIEKDR